MSQVKSQQAISPLRQRMIEDMRMRKLAPKTRDAYIRGVKKLSEFLGHSPPTWPRRKTCAGFSCI